MRLVELDNRQFDEFARFHPLNSYCQNSKYALVMSDYGYSYDYIGYVDDDNNIKAAALILTKKISGNTKYGYAPKGFLINFYDTELVRGFLDALREYYRKKDFIFIKFNPEIIIGETDKDKKYVVSYNGNVRIIDILKNMNVKRRLELQEFDLMLPKFNAYIDLTNFSLDNVSRSHRKRVKKCINKGMSLILGDAKQMDIFYKFIKNKTSKPIQFYRNLYNVYNRDNSIDLVFTKIDYNAYLGYVRNKYEEESNRNEQWNELISTNPRSSIINAKISSDKKLQALKSEIINATEGLKRHQEVIIAGALIIKHSNRVSIIASGYDDQYKNLNPNHFLYYSIFERYRHYFNFCDMNGVSGNFEDNSPYYGLNRFKEKWNGTIYEFIGEFDLICAEHSFKRLIKTSFIEDEFAKHRY